MKLLKRLLNWIAGHWPVNIFVKIWGESKERILLYLALLILSVAGTWFTYHYAINFSAIPITFAYMLVFIGFFELFDSKILTEIDTWNEINNGNTAVSQFYLAIAVLLLAVANIVG